MLWQGLGSRLRQYEDQRDVSVLSGEEGRAENPVSHAAVSSASFLQALFAHIRIRGYWL